MREGKYLLAPSSESSVLVFKRDNLGHFVDKIQGLPGSVDAVVGLADSAQSR